MSYGTDFSAARGPEALTCHPNRAGTTDLKPYARCVPVAPRYRNRPAHAWRESLLRSASLGGHKSGGGVEAEYAVAVPGAMDKLRAAQGMWISANWAASSHYYTFVDTLIPINSLTLPWTPVTRKRCPSAHTGSRCGSSGSAFNKEQDLFFSGAGVGRRQSTRGTRRIGGGRRFGRRRPGQRNAR